LEGKGEIAGEKFFAGKDFIQSSISLLKNNTTSREFKVIAPDPSANVKRVGRKSSNSL
jgi:hypothetical protein